MAAAICAGVLVSLLFLSYIMSSGLLHRRDTGITLPTGEADTPVVTADSQLLTAQSVADVDITTDNVQHVIASLTRPEAYSCTIENKLLYRRLIRSPLPQLRSPRRHSHGYPDRERRCPLLDHSQRRYHLFLER